MNINPRVIRGPWKAGYTLDDHTASSVYLGDDARGKPQFDTLRTDLGECLFQLKYRDERSAAKKLAKVAADFLLSKSINVEVVVPIPPSKERSFQPLQAIAKHVAAFLDAEYDGLSLRKIKETPELKSVEECDARAELLADAFAVRGTSLRGRRVLLLDDLYRSGASMAAVSNTLRASANVESIVALALTRTRTRR